MRTYYTGPDGLEYSLLATYTNDSHYIPTIERILTKFGVSYHKAGSGDIATIYLVVDQLIDYVKSHEYCSDIDCSMGAFGILHIIMGESGHAYDADETMLGM